MECFWGRIFFPQWRRHLSKLLELMDRLVRSEGRNRTKFHRPASSLESNHDLNINVWPNLLKGGRVTWFKSWEKKTSLLKQAKPRLAASFWWTEAYCLSSRHFLLISSLIYSSSSVHSRTQLQKCQMSKMISKRYLNSLKSWRYRRRDGLEQEVMVVFITARKGHH